MRQVHSNILDRQGNPFLRDVDLDPAFWRADGYGGETIVKEPYANHAWVYACVRAVVQPTAMLYRFVAETDRYGEHMRKDYSHPIVKLMRKPNPMMSGSELWESILLALMLPTTHSPGGQVFLYMDSGVEGRPYDIRNPQNKLPMRIWPYTDNVIRPRQGQSVKSLQTKMQWDLVVNGVTLRKFEDGEILRIRLFNPYNPALGLSPYSAVTLPIGQDRESDRLNTEYMKNNGALGGLLTTDSEEISTQELKKLTQAFEDTYGGASNAGRTAALSYGLKYQNFMQSNADMQYMEMRADNRLRIQAAYGVNGEELGIYESGFNRATAEQASRDVWIKTRLPLIQRIDDTMNALWVENLGVGRSEIGTDISGVDALRDIYETEIGLWQKMVVNGVAPSEAARLVGIPLDSDAFPELMQGTLPMARINTKDAVKSAGLPTPSSGAEPKELPAPDTRSVDDLAARESTLKYTEFWYRYVRDVLDPGEASMKRMWMKLWRAQTKAFSKNTTEALVKDVTFRELIIPTPASLMWDIEEFREILVEEYGKETAKQMNRTAKELKNETLGAIDWNAQPEDVERFVTARFDVLMDIDNGTSKDVFKVYNDLSEIAIDEGWTTNQFARAVREGMDGLVDNYDLHRSVAVARTETGSITSASRIEAFKNAGINKHRWITAKDARVRESHVRVDETVVEVGRTFENGLLWPLQAGAPPEEVIQCRCVTIPEIPENNDEA